MKVEAGGVEGPIVGVAIGGFKVASRVKIGRVPETAAEISE